MKSSIVALVCAASITVASPTPLDLKTILGSNKHHDKGNYPFFFTSTYKVHAKPSEVVDAQNKPTGGLAGSEGTFLFGINSHDNVICYNITLRGFRGEYQSPAKTATHIHQAARGSSGPPRIAFPNPEETSTDTRNSIGCIRGPFTTGVKDAAGKDTGEGFHVKQIEEKPDMFFSDVHSSLAVPGAMRGQLANKKC